jgi:hypothetical protein
LGVPKNCCSSTMSTSLTSKPRSPQTLGDGPVGLTWSCGDEQRASASSPPILWGQSCGANPVGPILSGRSCTTDPRAAHVADNASLTGFSLVSRTNRSGPDDPVCGEIR